MSQINEETAAVTGSNVVGDGKVDMNVTGGKLGEPKRRKIADEMSASLKERAARNFKKEPKKQ